MSRTSLRTLLKRRDRAKYRGMTSKRGMPVQTHFGWFWGFWWMFRPDRAQKKPKPTWRRL